MELYAHAWSLLIVGVKCGVVSLLKKRRQLFLHRCMNTNVTKYQMIAVRKNSFTKVKLYAGYQHGIVVILHRNSIADLHEKLS